MFYSTVYREGLVLAKWNVEKTKVEPMLGLPQIRFEWGID